MDKISWQEGTGNLKQDELGRHRTTHVIQDMHCEEWWIFYELKMVGQKPVLKRKFLVELMKYTVIFDEFVNYVETMVCKVQSLDDKFGERHTRNIIKPWRF